MNNRLITTKWIMKLSIIFHLLSKFEIHKEFFDFITSKYPCLKHQFFNYY